MLPGVGIRYELTTASGHKLCMVVRREGHVELFSYDPADPDRAVDPIRFSASEASALAKLFGAPRMSQRFADLSREVPGLESARLTLLPGSRYDGRELGATHARTRTGASIVAVVRGDDVTTSPSPDHVLRAGDVVVSIGSDEALIALEELLQRKPD